LITRGKEICPFFYVKICGLNLFPLSLHQQIKQTMAKLDWNFGTIKPLAEQCKSKWEFSIKFSTAYKYALSLGIINTLFPKNENIEGYLSQFKSRSELSKKNVRKYIKYKNSGVLDEILPPNKRGRKAKEIVLKTNNTNKIFVEKKPTQSWTPEKLKIAIAECGTLTELNKKYRGAYNFGRKNGFI